MFENADGTKLIFPIRAFPFIITVKTELGLKEYVLNAHLGPDMIRSMTLR